MIVTVTPNPSLDRTVLVDQLARGAVHRSCRVHLDPGGKGVNVSRAVAAAGGSTVALMPSGGAEGARVVQLLEPESVPVVEVPVHAATRSNVAVVEADGTTSKFNDLGPQLTSAEIKSLEARTEELAARAEWVVTGGSLPAGCADDLHARLVRSARRAGARVAVDASGPSLAQACQSGPDLVKPNLAELAEWADRPLGNLGEVHKAALDMRAAGVEAVLVSLGEHGALLVEEAGTWHATSTAAAVRSTVGAGDAMVAGFLLAGGSGPTALRAAVGYGTAAVELPGSRMPAPSHARTETVRVNELDESLSLTGVAA